MKISIIIPVYNKAEYIEKCVASCLAQTFADFEIIAVDDGSKDNDGQLLDAMALEDHRLRVIHTANGGVTAARKVGWEQAQGECVSFVDADDELLPDALQRLHGAMAESGADEVIGTYVNQYGRLFSTHRKGWVGHDLLLKEILANSSRFCVLWGVLFKRELLAGCLDTPRVIRTGEDRLMQVMVLMREPRVYFMDEPVYYYNMDIPNDRTLNIPEERAYDKLLREVLAPKWDRYKDYYVLRQLKQYEKFVDQRRFGEFEDYYQSQLDGKLNGDIPLADRMAYMLPPRLAYYPIHWRKHLND